MKKSFAYACFGAFCSFGLLTASAAEGVVTADLLNVRLKPDLRAPVAVKLDRGFIKNCTSSAREINFLNKIVQMIQALGYRVACEGIETEEQARILRDAGCDEAQGYLYSQPLPIEEYEQLVYPTDA